MTLHTPPLAGIMMGAISFINPGKKEGLHRLDRTRTFRLYSSLDYALSEAYLPVNIHFPADSNLDVNAKIRHEGIEIGYVKAVSLGKNSDSILVKALVRKSASRLLTTGAKVWIVRPQFSLAGIRNLGAVVTGPYIALQKGPGAPCMNIKGLAAPPPVTLVKSGLNIVAEASTLGSLRKRSPVYYRRVQIGRVTGYELAPDARTVWIHVNIDKPYAPLVRTGTRFWNASGIKVDAGLFSGVDVKTETVEAIIAGGIAITTPEGEEMGTLAESGHHFNLHEKADEDWLKWNPAITLKK